jgi:hypothetical protein
MKTILLLNTPYYITLRVLASWSATLLNIIQVVDSLLSKDHSKKNTITLPFIYISVSFSNSRLSLVSANFVRIQLYKILYYTAGADCCFDKGKGRL